MVSQYLTGTVSKYSGMNTLSVELLERSDPNFYAELTQQLQNAYLTTIDTAVLTALYTHADTDVVFTSITASGPAIYIAGYSGIQSFITLQIRHRAELYHQMC